MATTTTTVPVKFIQITTVEVSSIIFLYALDNAGNVWLYTEALAGWQQLPTAKLTTTSLGA